MYYREIEYYILGCSQILFEFQGLEDDSFYFAFISAVNYEERSIGKNYSLR